jgi:hypothetical protein
MDWTKRNCLSVPQTHYHACESQLGWKVHFLEDQSQALTDLSCRALSALIRSESGPGVASGVGRLVVCWCIFSFFPFFCFLSFFVSSSTSIELESGGGVFSELGGAV